MHDSLRNIGSADTAWMTARRWLTLLFLAWAACDVATAVAADTKVNIAVNRNFPFLAVWVAKRRGSSPIAASTLRFSRLEVARRCARR